MKYHVKHTSYSLYMNWLICPYSRIWDTTIVNTQNTTATSWILHAKIPWKYWRIKCGLIKIKCYPHNFYIFLDVWYGLFSTRLWRTKPNITSKQHESLPLYVFFYLLHNSSSSNTSVLFELGWCFIDI